MRRRPNLLLANEGGLDLVAIAGGARLVKSNAKISFVTRAGVTVEKADLLKSGEIDPATPIGSRSRLPGLDRRGRVHRCASQ
jgi:hypothetical protein